ncbi:hypothetical protein BD414DRAFT_502093 [Trametes punicea]|nr:hypothetical protein BD414DRAFT_502093 [Trametes punicea]
MFCTAVGRVSIERQRLWPSAGERIIRHRRCVCIKMASHPARARCHRAACTVTQYILTQYSSAQRRTMGLSSRGHVSLCPQPSDACKRMSITHFLVPKAVRRTVTMSNTSLNLAQPACKSRRRLPRSVSRSQTHMWEMPIHQPGLISLRTRCCGPMQAFLTRNSLAAPPPRAIGSLSHTARGSHPQSLGEQFPDRSVSQPTPSHHRSFMANAM